MTIVITLGLHTGCVGSIFITGIFGNFYTKRGGGFLTFRTGIPGGLVRYLTDTYNAMCFKYSDTATDAFQPADA